MEHVYETKAEKEPAVAQKNNENENENEKEEEVLLNPKAEGEVGLISTVLGCRENRDRIEFAQDLKDYVEMLELSKEDKEKKQKSRFILASDYQLNLSSGLKTYIKKVKV